MSSLILGGDTSGTITLTVPTAAGTNTITLPALTGTAITSASTSGIPGTVNWTTVQTSSVSPAVAGTGYPMNTTSGALTVTLPAAPTAGQLISIMDYAGTAATNNITIALNGNKCNGSTANPKMQTSREVVNLVYVDSTQGWLAYSDVYSTDPLVTTYTASYLIIAGGGGSGWNGAGPSSGAGGGAGGYLTGTTTLNIGTTYSLSIGAGGASGGADSQPGSNGSPTTFTGLTTAVGGGKGTGANNSGVGGPGGSGGGGSTSFAGGSGTPGQGNNGGSNNSNCGGGGSGSAGISGLPGAGGNATANSITGTPVSYAGGGNTSNPASPTAGGSTAYNTSGAANTGSGGGGCAPGTTPATLGSGGSGVVILSVPTASYSGTTTGSPTITTSGSNTILKWTSASGSYTA